MEQQIKESLLNQNNRCTADCYYVVFNKEKIYGMDENYADECETQRLQK